jgi:acyl-CoA reductase-like NAD-dependent aldehyde dehydrogenase
MVSETAERFDNYIGGRWTPSSSTEAYAIHNPARPLSVLAEFPSSTDEDVHRAVEAAAQAQPEWARVPPSRRARLLLTLADLLDRNQEELARIITKEQGKVLRESRGEVGRAALEARFAAGEATRAYGTTLPDDTGTGYCSVVYEPLGVIAAIAPWNFPVVTPVRKIAPALAYGNTVVLKPASQTPWSSVYLARLLEQAGFPHGVVNVLIGRGAKVGDTLVDHPGVNGISFTGSTDVGRRIYTKAAERLVRVQLELGGKNPAVVVDCDDLAAATKEIATAAFTTSGQRCTALSRVIVTFEQADELVRLLTLEMRKLRIGDGLDEECTMGPLVSHRQLEQMQAYVAKGTAEGAQLVEGGKAAVDDPTTQGFFFQPTLFDHVTPDSVLATEEMFGPILPVIRVGSSHEAIEVANQTRYGLAASLFTSNLKLAQEFQLQVRAGMVHINHGTASQAHVPFGGVKESGQGAYSIGATNKDFFMNMKVVYTR